MKSYNKTNGFEGLLRETKGKGRKKNYVLQFSGPANVSDAHAMKDLLDEALAKKKPVTVDLSEVTECDISLIQLLLSLGRSDNRSIFELASLPPQNIVKLNARLSGITPEIDKETDRNSLFGLILSDREGEPS